MNYDNELTKTIYRDTFKNYVQKQHQDYNIYFVTYTFKNTFNNSVKLSPFDVFVSFKQKLLQASTNRPHKKDHDVKLLCIRETSQECRSRMLRKEDHYHCFLMIHKKNENRFYKRAVESIDHVKYDLLDKTVQKLNFFEKIYKNKRTLKNDKNPLSIYDILNPKIFLENHTLDVRLLQSKEDVNRVYDYACKNICSIKLNCTQTQLREYLSQSVFKKQYISSLENEDFILI